MLETLVGVLRGSTVLLHSQLVKHQTPIGRLAFATHLVNISPQRPAISSLLRSAASEVELHA